jgi:hypothetical protein
MKPIMFQTTDWNEVPVTESRGELGTSYHKTLLFDSLRVRIVEYSANYKADHWCKAGHILYCLEGEIISEMQDGRTFRLTKGMSYIVTNDDSCHRSYSENGAKLMIVDGGFLNGRDRLERNPWKM